MRLETLLPRPLDPCGGSECATLMGALIAAIHLDRRRARALGWRGGRPSGSLLPAWTCRVAGSGLVFGLVFFGEDADGGALRGTFAAYAFPLPDDPLLEVFPLEALRLAVDPGYGDRIRALSEHAETLSPFRIGTVSLRAAVDGSGLSLTLSAPARLRMAALDGVATFSGGQRWLVEPGGWETDVPAFRLLLRPFAALSATAESLLGDPARVSLDGEAAPIPGFDAAGNIRHIPGGTGRELRLTAAFGSAGAQGRPLARLPLRHKPLEEESGLPVLHILTGFLGSGKTTFLRQWLDFLHGRERYTGVIQNEFGEIGLDAALLRGETQVEALDEAAAAADDVRTAAQKAEADARGRAEALQREAVELERRTAKLVLEEREARSAWEAWQRREADLRRSREEMEIEAERAQERVEAALGAVETKTEALDEIQHAAGEAAALHDRLHDRLIDLKRAAAESIHREAMKKLEASQARESRTEAERRLAETQSDIARESKRLEETREVLDAREDERLQTGTSELLEKNASLEKALAAAQTELEAARSKREDEQRQIKRLNESILPLTEEIARLRVEAEQKAGLLGQFSGRMQELGADWTELSKLAEERGVKANTVRNEVTRLMNEIAALGPVNHAALAHLEAAQEAIRLAEAQMQDLRQAIETLEAAIRRIDAETRARMRETFDKVNEKFNDTFRGLFGGGRAALRMEGDEILSAGVEVSAQPPGKRNQTVRLLSGGEQALTATALVFAMFKLNPAPFCLLDEVDAPLDEANQGRLARLCTEMSVDTQFLIITHHRVTMEYAKALIGVTMKEPGVSRVVSVDIAEAVGYAQQANEPAAAASTSSAGSLS